jgi:hypothetical protein
MHMGSPPYIPGDEVDELRATAPEVYAELLAVQASRITQLRVHGTAPTCAELLTWVANRVYSFERTPDFQFRTIGLSQIADAAIGHGKADNRLNTMIRRVQTILTDVRWDYGPPSEVEEKC